MWGGRREGGIARMLWRSGRDWIQGDIFGDMALCPEDFSRPGSALSTGGPLWERQV